MSKTKKNRCYYINCVKKINIVDTLSSECKCKQVYCLSHRLPERHNCQYDFSSEVDKDKEIGKLRCVSEYEKI